MVASVARWRRVVLDANVLVQAPIRDVILRAAEDELLTVCWGPTILEEVERTLRDKLFAGRPDAIERTDRLLQALAQSFPRALHDDGIAGLPALAIGPGVEWSRREIGMCWRRLCAPVQERS